MKELAKRRGRRQWAAAVGLVAVVTAAVAESAAASPVQPATVFEVSRSLAIEAARTRLRLFVDDNPEADAGSVPADLPECPLISVASLGDVASVVGSARSVDIRLQADPWLGRTTSDPELRPDFAPEGEVAGLPIVRCDTVRPSDGQISRPSMFALNLTGGVTFGDVVRLYALEGTIPIQPIGIGGQQVGECLGRDNTSVCVVLWSSRSVVIGLSLEGPPDAVNTSTAGAFLSASVPTVINTLAVVTQPAPLCSADVLLVQTGIGLLGEPLCADGWAFGTTVECPPPATSAVPTTDSLFPRGLRAQVVPLEDCAAVDVFHFEPEGWIYDGSIDVSCTENLTRLGMTVVTAREIAPEPCDDDDPSLAVGTIRPNTVGTRVAALQIALANIGYVFPVDGRYGPLTESSVVDFQERNGLVVDGVAGRQTQAALGI
jgi:hypothetical protein